jgi:hypothetical protein
MFLIFLLTTVLGVPSYSTYTTSLDPAPIAYPNNWYSNIIDLSSNHASQIVTLTINCNLAMTLYPGAYVAVNIDGFAPGDLPITITILVTQPTTSDNVFTFSGVVLPSATKRRYSSLGFSLRKHSSPRSKANPGGP